MSVPKKVPPYTPRMSDEAIAAKTGKPWHEWFRLLDRWNAPEKGHKATAVHLQEQYGISGWWSQTVTVEFERSRGLREPGQKGTGEFEVSVQRTVALPKAELMKRWTDGRQRARWLSDPLLRDALRDTLRSARKSETTMGTCLRVDVMPKDVRTAQTLQLTFDDKDDGRSLVHVQHGRLPDKKTRDEYKARWVEVLDRLKASA